MVASKDLPCWEITRCGNQDKCLAGMSENAGQQCWQVARKLDDYRSAMNVCKDCIVYVTKHANTALSEQELENILQHKVDCVLVSSCPRYIADGGRR
ncbi:MAG: hypothetical protein OEY01_13275 [Desulfobulbaceae bacterium]|nr:hypothetical protein [Desulfobulbaceae bacterium]HIJ79701.1 hypothetical protein [Deltaproteobacteria bacterium]